MKSELMAFIFTILLGWYYCSCEQGVDKTSKSDTKEVGKLTPAFNSQITAALTGYDSIKSALVDADTSRVKAATKGFISAIDSVRVDEIKKDTSLAEAIQSQVVNIRSNADALLQQNDLTEIREDFRMISESLFSFLKAIKYDGQKLYWQNCPMAFGEGKDANWISSTREIINPYLGKHHPEYKGTMLHCGIVSDSIQ